MRIEFMKTIDMYVGALICLILSSYEKIFSKKADFNNPKKILFIKFWGMGSIILMTPAIMSIKNRFPDARINILTLYQNKDLCESFGFFDNITTINIKSAHNFIFDVYSKLYLLRKERFDLVIDFEPYTRFSSILTYVLGYNLRVGYLAISKPGKTNIEKSISFILSKFGYNTNYKVWRSKLYNKLLEFDDNSHMTINFGKAAKAFNAKVNINLAEPKYSREDEKYTIDLLNKNNIKGKDTLVCLNANASNLAIERRWPAQNFIELSKRLLKKYNIKLIFIGSKDDIEYTKFIVDSINNKKVINLAGKTSIRQLIALFKNSDLIITNDSGPLHLAAALKKKTVSFFGPETPLLYGPLEKNHIVFYKNLYCSPCIRIYNRKTITCMNEVYMACMKNITVDEVFNNIVKNKLLGNI